MMESIWTVVFDVTCFEGKDEGVEGGLFFLLFSDFDDDKEGGSSDFNFTNDDDDDDDDIDGVVDRDFEVKDVASRIEEELGRDLG